MSEYGPTYNEIDSYVSELTDEERDTLATAETAIELAFLLHRARQVKGLTQENAAQLAGLHQQAVSRFEQPDMKLAGTKFDTLRKYLTALGYAMHMGISDAASGAMVGRICLKPSQEHGTSVENAASRRYDAQASGYVLTTQGGAGQVIPGNDDLIRVTKQPEVA